MALLFMDGFEHYVTADAPEKWDSTGTIGISSSYARTGSYAMTASGNKVIISSDPTVIIGFGMRLVGWGGAFTICSGGFGSTGYYQCCIEVTSAGEIRARRQGTVGTILGTSAPGVIRLGVWQYIEWKTLLNNTTGTITVKVNGATVLTLTAQDTNGCTAEGAWSGVSIDVGGGGNALDDLYVADGSGSQNNDFLGECRVVTLLPQTDAVAAGSNAQFTPSTGTDHGALVDEAAPNDDTDYLSSSTLNHVDSWHYPALGYTGTIKGVQMSAHAKKTDSGTRAIAAVTRPASTNRVHATNHYLGTSYAYWMSLWELNPEDSAAWEVADVDGAEFGVKVTV